MMVKKAHTSEVFWRSSPTNQPTLSLPYHKTRMNVECVSSFSFQVLFWVRRRRRSSSSSSSSSMAGITSMSLSSTSSSSCLRSTTFTSNKPSSSSGWGVALRTIPPRSYVKIPIRYTFQKILCYTSNDIKVGANILVDGAPYRVLEFLHVKPGKGAAFVRTKIRSYVSGSTVEKTFRAGISMSEADISKEIKQFTYKDGSQYVFMDLSTYEETRLNESDIGDKRKWLKEGLDCILLFWNGKIIDFDVPLNVKMTVSQVDPGLKGDTVQGGSKPATLDTGVVVNVPLFVNTGDEIMVDTKTGQYMNRV